MDKYVRVDWPESQKWNELANYSDEYGIYICDMIAFVPEELYNRVKGLVPTKRKNLFLKPANNE